jgi:hypothetical protein
MLLELRSVEQRYQVGTTTTLEMSSAPDMRESSSRP